MTPCMSDKVIPDRTVHEEHESENHRLDSQQALHT
jgi:hypothetical protein